MQEVVVRLDDKNWRFSPTDAVTAPGLPIKKFGNFVNNEDGRMFYVIDKNSEIWLGSLKEQDVILEHFRHSMAMDVIFNYNILAWAKISYQLPLSVYAKIRSGKK
jgi:hypothetical protein